MTHAQITIEASRLCIARLEHGDLDVWQTWVEVARLDRRVKVSIHCSREGYESQDGDIYERRGLLCATRRSVLQLSNGWPCVIEVTWFGLEPRRVFADAGEAA